MTEINQKDKRVVDVKICDLFGGEVKITEVLELIAKDGQPVGDYKIEMYEEYSCHYMKLVREELESDEVYLARKQLEAQRLEVQKQHDERQERKTLAYLKQKYEGK